MGGLRCLTLAVLSCGLAPEAAPAQWSEPVSVAGSSAGSVGYVYVSDGATPPALEWRSGTQLRWTRPLGDAWAPVESAGEDATRMLLPYGDREAFRLSWAGSGILIDHRAAPDGFQRRGRLGWDLRYITTAVTRRGAFSLLIDSPDGPGLWLASGTPGALPTRRVRITREQPRDFVVSLADNGHGAAAWVTSRGVYLSRFRGSRIEQPVRVWAGRARGRALYLANATDGSALLAWYDPAGASQRARLRVGVLRGRSRTAASFTLGPSLTPRKAPDVALSPNADGLVAWQGGDVIYAALLRRGVPGEPRVLAGPGGNVAAGDADARPAGSTQGFVWAQADGVYARLAGNGRWLGPPEHVSADGEQLPAALSTSFAFDSCSGRAYVGWAAVDPADTRSRVVRTASRATRAPDC